MKFPDALCELISRVDDLHQHIHRCFQNKWAYKHALWLYEQVNEADDAQLDITACDIFRGVIGEAAYDEFIGYPLNKDFVALILLDQKPNGWGIPWKYTKEKINDIFLAQIIQPNSD